MTAPVIMCVVCATLDPADRPLDPNPPHDPLPTDGVTLREGQLLCQAHADGHDQVVQTGGVFRR